MSMALFSSLSTILMGCYNVILARNDPTDDPTFFKIWMNIFFVLAAVSHIFLLYLRTIAVLQFAPNHLLLLKCGVGFIVAAIFEIVVFSSSFFQPVFRDLIVTGYSVLSISFVVMDCFTATVFAVHIYKERKYRKNQDRTMIKGTDVLQTTDIIAGTGLVIAMIFLVDVLLFLLTEFGPTLNIFANISTILWMRMRLQVEKLNSAQASNGNSGQSSH
jgi:hypothetical protein